MNQEIKQLAEETLKKSFTKEFGAYGWKLDVMFNDIEQKTIIAAMCEMYSAAQQGLDFARFLEECTRVIYEDKITLYRYDGVDGAGNYTLDDIYTVYKEKYGTVSAALTKEVECYVPVEIKDGCEMPKEGNYVHVLINGKTKALAMYTSGGKIEFDDEFEDFPECFDEKAGVSYLPEGWWEMDADEEKTFKRDNVTHWLKKTTLPIKDTAAPSLRWVKDPKETPTQSMNTEKQTRGSHLTK